MTVMMLIVDLICFLDVGDMHKSAADCVLLKMKICC